MGAETPPENATGGSAKTGQSGGTDIDRTVVDPLAQERLRAAAMSEVDKTISDPVAQARLRAAGHPSAADTDKTLVNPSAHPKIADVDERTVVNPRSPSEPVVGALDTRHPSSGSNPDVHGSKSMTNSPTRGFAPVGYVPLPPAETLTLPVGFKLFEYQIDVVLGQGGFGITYLAKDVNLNVRVAIKEYLPEDFAYRCTDRSVSAKLPEDQDFYQTGLDSFLEEARTLATFRHPNIVRVARFFEAHRTAYMVLEYERGESLKAWRKSHPDTPERELLTLFWPLLEGLSVVHESGFLHRDIKPDNIYVRDEDGSLVLLDFGAARQTAHAQLDQTGIFTPGYGPIEQYSGVERQGPWTDIYALGATLFWLLTGKKPIEASLRLVDPDPQPSVEKMLEGKYSVDFLRAIDWALQVQPEKRPKDMVEFRNKLYAAHAASLGLEAALSAGDEGDAHELKQGEGWSAALTQPKLLKTRLIRFSRAFARPASWPIAIKLTLAMVLTALLPMLITAYYNLNGSIEAVSKSELRNLEQLSQSTAGRISQLIGDSRNLANYMGTDDDFVSFLNAPNESGKAAIRSKLEGLIKANPDVQLAMVMDTEGVALVSSDPQVMGRNFKFREYFKSAMEGKTHMTGIVVGSVAGQAGVFYSNPVFNADKKIVGAVVLRILGSSIGKILVDVQQGQNRIPFLVDGDGIIIYHPNEKLLYKSLMPLPEAKLKEIIADQRFRRDKIDSINQPELANAMVGSRVGGNISYKSSLSRADEIAGYSPVPGHNWMVGVSESREYFEAPLTKVFNTVLYSVVIVGFIFVLLAWLLARTIVKPIEELTAAAHALKGGDYDKATLTVRSTDEIGRLARTFNVMIDVLRQRERERHGKRDRRQPNPNATSNKTRT